MMNRDELGVMMSPRPGPISSANDLLIPGFGRVRRLGIVYQLRAVDTGDQCQQRNKRHS